MDHHHNHLHFPSAFVTYQLHSLWHPIKNFQFLPSNFLLFSFPIYIYIFSCYKKELSIYPCFWKWVNAPVLVFQKGRSSSAKSPIKKHLLLKNPFMVSLLSFLFTLILIKSCSFKFLHLCLQWLLGSVWCISKKTFSFAISLFVVWFELLNMNYWILAGVELLRLCLWLDRHFSGYNDRNLCYSETGQIKTKNKKCALARIWVKTPLWHQPLAIYFSHETPFSPSIIRWIDYELDILITESSAMFRILASYLSFFLKNFITVWHNLIEKIGCLSPVLVFRKLHGNARL